MSGTQDVTYAVDFGGRKPSKWATSEGERPASLIPRIARLMALAIRFEGLVRQGTIRDYAELARRGRVTRARMFGIGARLQSALPCLDYSRNPRADKVKIVIVRIKHKLLALSYCGYVCLRGVNFTGHRR
jgi:hypothetical protein